MNNTLMTYLQLGKRFYGVEHTQLDGVDKFYGITLKKKRNQLDIDACFESNSFEDLKTHIPKHKPILLVINTASVLTKKVSSKSDDILRLVHLAFPNIKVDEFYFETISQGENHFVSICRKIYVDQLLDSYTSKQITIVGFTLGNLIYSNVSPFINSDFIQTSNAGISIKDDLISNIEFKSVEIESSYNINGLDIKSNYMLSCSAALNAVVNNQNIQSSFVNVKKEMNTAFKQKKFANQFSKIGLSTLFIALLINFLFFNHYYNSVNTLRQTTQVLGASKAKMLKLNEEVQKTEKLVADILSSSSSKSSFYIDNIINNLPEAILLNELNYQPLLKKIKQGDAIKNEEHTIIISGVTNESLFFSNPLAAAFRLQ